MICLVRYTSRAPLSKWVSGILQRFLYTQNLTGPTQVTQCVQWSTQKISPSFQRQMEPPHPDPDLSECTHFRPCDVSWPIISTSMRSRDWGSQLRSRLQPHEAHTSFNLQSRDQQIPPIKKAQAYLTRGTGHTLELQSMKRGQPRDVVTHLKSF